MVFVQALWVAWVAGLVACGSRTGMLSAIGADAEVPICPGDPSCPGTGTGTGGSGGMGTTATTGAGGSGGVGAGGTGTGGGGGIGGDGAGGVGGIIVTTGGTGGGGGTGGAGGAAGSGGIGPCTTGEGRPCTPEQCVNRCHRFQIGGYAELRSSARRCACEGNDRCAGVCASTVCIGEHPDSACQQCFIPLVLNPPSLASCAPATCPTADVGPSASADSGRTIAKSCWRVCGSALRSERHLARLTEKWPQDASVETAKL